MSPRYWFMLASVCYRLGLRRLARRIADRGRSRVQLSPPLDAIAEIMKYRVKTTVANYVAPPARLDYSIRAHRGNACQHY